jgi:outer membrane protein TolC
MPRRFYRTVTNRRFLHLWDVRRLHFLCPLFPLLVLSLAAASPASAETLTLERAITLALAANPDLRAAAAAEAEARERREAAAAGWFPRLTVDEGWQRGNQPVFVFGSLLGQRRFTEANFAVSALNHPDPVDNVRASVGLSQALFDGGATAAAVRAAGASASLASAARRDAAGQVTVAVAQAYGAVLTAEAAVRAAGAAIDAATEDAARARARRDAGLVTDADVLALEVHLAQMRARRIGSAGDAAIARATLNRLVGAPLETEWDLLEPSAPLVEPLDLAAAEAAAIRDRPDVAAAALRVERALADASAARAALLPRVGMEGGYEWNGARWGDRASSWVVGIRAQWSLSLAGGERAASRAAGHAVERARAEQESADTAARLDVRTASARLDAARASQDVATAAVAGARESERIIRDRFDSGLAGVTDVLRAANALLEADTLATAATVNVRVAAIVLDRARGRLSTVGP